MRRFYSELEPNKNDAGPQHWLICSESLVKTFEVMLISKLLYSIVVSSREFSPLATSVADPDNFCPVPDPKFDHLESDSLYT
jgi:hypothetical protein